MAEGRRTGGVTVDEIEALVRIAELPPEAGASSDARFCMDVARLVAARAAAQESGAFSLFLRSEALVDDAAKAECVHVPLLHNGNDPISGHVWLSTIGIRSSYRVQLDVSDDAAFVASVLEAGFGHMPTVVVDWRGTVPIGRLYPEGLSRDDLSYQVSFSKLPISEENLKSTLDNFYETVLRTPSAISRGNGRRIWSDARRGVPAPRPEERIQGRLLDTLKGSYPTHTWRAEPVTEDGRADIVAIRKIMAQGRPATITEWVLELKALADMTSTGNPVAASVVADAIESAIEQAIAYRCDHNAERAAACYFDMRREDVGDDECFSEIIDIARDENIPLWRWYLHRSTPAARAGRGYLNSSAGR